MNFNIFRYFIIIFNVFLLFNIFPGFLRAEEITSSFLIKHILPDKSGKLLFLGGEKNQNSIVYKTVRLTDPDRLVIDIENAILKDEDGKLSVKVNNEKISEAVRIAQFSTDPKTVRVVITVNDAKLLDKIKITPYKSGLALEFDEVKLTNLASPSIYRDKNKKDTTATEEITVEESESDNKEAILKKIKEKIHNNIVITNVKHYDNRILLSGTGIISIGEPFVLDSPDRVIFDISDAVLDSSDLIGTIELKNNDSARIAQFDTRTIRVVIESDEPEKYTHAVSPDLQSIIISPAKSLSFAEFPDNNVKAEIQDIQVIKDNDTTTKLILVSEKPIIHSIERSYAPDKIRLNMYNANSPPDKILENLEKTPQFHGFEFDKSAWNIPISNSTTIESKLSLDGRKLVITLTDAFRGAAATGSSKPIKAKIIIDPGHGGYDPGAEKNGLYEKDIVLDVSRRIKKYLDEHGFYVIMTRENDKTLSLKERVALTNKENPDVFLSVHANASNDPDIKGIETHWYTLESRPLAMHVQNQMVDMLVTPDRGLKNSRFYVLRNSKIPAVLAEIGYMTNSIELYQLMTEERREATAKSIADGILNYLRSKNNQTVPDGRKQL